MLLRAHVTAGVQASVAHPGALRISDRSLRRGHIFEKAAPVAQHAGRWRCSSACGRAEHGPRHGHQEPAVTTSLRVSRMAKDHADQNQTGGGITLSADNLVFFGFLFLQEARRHQTSRNVSVCFLLVLVHLVTDPTTERRNIRLAEALAALDPNGLLRLQTEPNPARRWRPHRARHATQGAGADPRPGARRGRRG